MLRKCVGCGELKPRENLIEPDSKTFGRSAYLCYNQSCIEAALKKSKLNKALRTNADVKGLLDGQYKSK